MKMTSVKNFKFYFAGGFFVVILIIVGFLRPWESDPLDPDGRRYATDQVNHGAPATNHPDLLSADREPSLKIVDRRPPEGGAVKRISELRKTSKHRPNYILFDRNNLITTQAADALGLSADDRLLVQDAMMKFSSEIRKIMKSKTKKDEELSSDGVDAYRIEPFEVEGETHFGNFLDALTEGLGDERAWAVAKAVPVEQLAGGLGANEVIFKVVAPDSSIIEGLPEDEIRSFFAVGYELRDPVSGKVKSGGKVDWLTFNRDNFGILE